MNFDWQQQGHHWQLSGEMTFDTLSKHARLFMSDWPKHDAWVLDCQQLTKVDSAGVAILMNCLAYARRQQLPLSIVGIAEDVVQLMRAQGVQQVFNEANLCP